MTLDIVSILQIIRNIVFLICGVLFVTLVFTIPECLKFRPRFGGHAKKGGAIITLRRAGMKERWERIVQKFEEGTPDAMKIAIIDADKFVDTLLKDGGLEGEHMADRLGQISRDDIKSLDALWSAHRYRNDLVHTQGMVIDQSEASRAIHGFHIFLEEIGMLDETVKL